MWKLFSDFVHLEDEMMSFTKLPRSRIRCCGCYFFFSTKKMFKFQLINKCPGILSLFHFYEMPGLSGALGDSVWLGRSEMWQCPDTINCLTLGKSLNPGQFEFPHLWREAIAVLCQVIFDWWIYEMPFKLTWIKIYFMLFPLPAFCQLRRINSHRLRTDVNFWREHTDFV